ncbi:putative delta3,5-delta2,4-dienoyl isomerase precursor (ech1) [Fusarium heterosporum]|uniref:Putative delta3,5-delta2,4-dienoyl isomerase (Ech1) n=1 Tax=Fusarium heterosporum TaxID=42747 RepID=A0A8H5WC59_FUSHE|nr:putative delta3,5-delta2,4-dienoyl isomerase precursor (ech1) [Fusarium heterosporum]
MSSATPLSAYTSYKHILVSSPGPFVAHVEINRPKKLNAFSQEVWLEFGSVFNQLSHDEDVRAVVISGAGDRAFTAGLDVQAASGDGILSSSEADIAKKAKVLRSHIEEFQDSIGAMEKCEKPVICVLHAISIGLAIDIACCADIRICASNTRFAVKEVDIGMAADIGTLARLPKLVGSTSWVKDVCLTARDFSAQEALSVGFVSQVHENKQAAVHAGVALATLLAEKSPVAVQGTKELLNHGRDHSVAESLRYTTIWNAAAVQGRDFAEGLMSGLKKTKPRFAKL